MKKLAGMLAGVAMLVSCGTGQADVLLGGQNWTFAGADNLTLTPVVPGGNQPLNTPCVICGDHQPQQPTLNGVDFGYTNFKNNGSDSDLLFFSTNIAGGGNPGPDTVGIGYSGEFLRAFLLANSDPTLTFSIGIDANDTNSPQTLESFFLLNLTTHTVLAAYRGGELIPTQNNGTGFPDYTLGTFNISLGTDIHLGDDLIFFARISGANDGPDSFFILPAVVPAPVVGAGIPGMLTALAGMYVLARRRKKQNA